MPKDLIRIGALKRARDLAGGVSFLARRLGVGVNALDAMIQGHEAVPAWVFIKAVDFIQHADDTAATPPGFPELARQRALRRRQAVARRSPRRR